MRPPRLASALLLLVVIVAYACRRDAVTAPRAHGLSFDVSSASSLIAFASNVDGRYHIYTVRPDGSSLTRLTSDSADDRYPAWSPDGRRIAFTSDRDTPRGDLYVMNADGSGATRLTNDAVASNPPRELSHPTWSPDGKQIVFSAAQGGFDGTNLFVINADGSGLTLLTQNPDYDENPSWSPDGARIVFDASRNLQPDGIYIMNRDGSAITEIVGSAQRLGGTEPSWSPDGTLIAAAGCSAAGICTMKPDGSAQTAINSAYPGASPSWAPSGQQIVFVSTRDGNNQLYVMGLDGSSPTRITNDAATDIEPSWQPASQTGGTPPGPYSIFDLGPGRPGDVNNSGQVAYTATMPDGSLRGLLWTDGDATNIGTLGGTNTVPLSINASAQIAGAGTDASGAWHEFLWTNGTLQDLGPGVAPPAIQLSDNFPDPDPALRVINDRGQVAWTGPVSTGVTHAFTWNGYAVQDLGALSGGSSSAAAINASGQVAGVSTDSSGVTHVVGWDTGTLYDLGTCPGSARVSIAGLNNHSQVLVNCLFFSSTGSIDSMNVDGYGYGQLWTLGTPPGQADAQPGGLTDSSAFFVNGFDFFGAPQYGQVFTWSNSSWTQVSARGTHAVAMNASGVVAGQVSYQPVHATVWDHGMTLTLGDLALYSSGNWSAAVTMNDSADVLGLSDNDVVLWKRGAVLAAARQRAPGTISAARVRVVQTSAARPVAPAIGPIPATRSLRHGPPKWQILMIGPNGKAKRPMK